MSILVIVTCVMCACLLHSIVCELGFAQYVVLIFLKLITYLCLNQNYSITIVLLSYCDGNQIYTVLVLHMKMHCFKLISD